MENKKSSISYNNSIRRNLSLEEIVVKITFSEKKYTLTETIWTYWKHETIFPQQYLQPNSELKGRNKIPRPKFI